MSEGMFFTQHQETVDLGNGNTVTLKKLNYGERQAALSAASETMMGSDGNPERVRLDMAVLQMEQMKHAIVSWDGPGFGGRQPSPRMIEQLDPGIIDRLVPTFTKLNRPMGDEEKKD
ncbi:hypothetical protein GC175_17045 [bacterium]|nr:hypothetical protein [bacterium]